jgi:membrane-bound lytic murein transglycosylase D
VNQFPALNRLPWMALVIVVASGCASRGAWNGPLAGAPKAPMASGGQTAQSMPSKDQDAGDQDAGVRESINSNAAQNDEASEGTDEVAGVNAADDAASDTPSAEQGHISDVGGDELLDPKAEEEVEATSVGSSVGISPVGSFSQVPTVMNDRVAWWIDYYTGRGRDRFQLHLDRADAFDPTIKAALREAGIAEDLFYIALIESGFSTKARSHAGAVGVWQFIRATGRRYGLSVSRGIDERMDPVRSTQAATRYLGDLYNIFNDWYLAFAAYNCGEFRVMRSIVTGKTRDFWELSEKKLLPKETRHYVPKFLAAMEIAKNRQKYGFVQNEVTARTALKAVDVAPGTRLSDVARTAGVDTEVLVQANPHLLNKQAPKKGRSYAVWVPENAVAAVAALGVAGPSSIRDTRDVVAEEATSKEDDPVEFHRVARGETLSSIAREYGTTVRRLREWNGMSSSRSSLKVGQRLQVGGTTTAKKTTVQRAKVESQVAERKNTASSQEFIMYRVRSGDSLNKIGRRFGIGASRIKKVNDLARNHLYAGEVLRVPAGG